MGKKIGTFLEAMASHAGWRWKMRDFSPGSNRPTATDGDF